MTIVLVGLLIAVCVFYLFFLVILINGIMLKLPKRFIPYIIYDVLVLYLSLLVAIAAVIDWNFHLFCFGFFQVALKVHPINAIFSLYIEYGGNFNREIYERGNIPFIIPPDSVEAATPEQNSNNLQNVTCSS